MGSISGSRSVFNRIITETETGGDWRVPAGENASVRLGDAAGATVFEWLDSANVRVGSVDSDGNATFTSVTASSSLFLGDNLYFGFGNVIGTPDVRLGWNTTQTVDALYLGLSDAQNTFLIAENGDRAFDFAHGAQTNPTVFIHSAVQSTTQWLSLAHNQTNAEFGIGTGSFLFEGAIISDGTVLEQFVVRQNADAGDVFVIDTLNPAAAHASPPNVVHINANGGNAFAGTGNQITYLQIDGNLSSGTQSGRIRGVDSILTTSGSAIASGTGGSAFRSFNASVAWNSTGTAAELVGINNTILAGGGAGVTSGLITDAHAEKLRVGFNPDDIPDGGSFTRANALYIQSPASTSALRTIGTVAGIRIDDQEATGITTAYSILTGTGRASFGGLVDWNVGTVPTATLYQIGRNNDGTNLMQLNVPTGASFEFSVNDVAEMTLSASAVNFQNNSIATTGGGSLTGTWSDLGIVTTVDINGGTVDGVTIGGAAAGAGTFTALVATSLDLNGALDLDVAALGATITNTNDGASSQVMILEGDRATMLDGDEAYLSLRLSDDTNTQTEFARITWVATDVNVIGDVEGRLDFAVITAGALADELQLDGTALSPSTTAGLALGTTALGYNALYLSSSAATQIDILAQDQGAGNNTAGRPLLIAAGSAGSLTTGAAGGALALEAGNAGGTDGNNGGNINLTAGTATGAGQAGVVNINQPGGTPGTDAMGFTHNGTDGVIINLDATGDITFGIGAGNTSFSVSAESVITAASIDVNMSAGGRLYGGGIQANKQDLAANTNLTLDENDSVVNVTTGAGSNNTITLPAASGNEGMIISIYMVTDGGLDAVLTRAGADVIQNGAADLANTTVTLDAAGDFVMVQCVNSTMWQILVNSGGVVA